MDATSDIVDLVRSGSAVDYELEDGLSQYPSVSLAAPGDVNGDGHADFLAGVVGGGEVHSIFTGFNYLFFGAPDLEGKVVVEDPQEPDLPEAGVVRIPGDIARMQTAGVTPVGDYNADGFDDFVITSAGKFSETGPTPPAGFYLMFGREEFPERIELGELGSWGLRVENLTRVNPVVPLLRNAGDFDGDGVHDLVVGEPRGRFDVEDFDPILAGRVSVIYGQAKRQTFVRGDCDGDGTFAGSVTDAISLILFAFAGAATTPPCLAACDVDGNGGIEGTTDAIYLLSFNFLGGEAPPYPVPGCGVDTGASEVLDCAAYPKCDR